MVVLFLARPGYGLASTDEEYRPGREAAIRNGKGRVGGKFHKEMAHPGVRLSGRAQRGPSPGRRAGAPTSPRGEVGGEIRARKKGVQSLHVE